MKKTAFVLAAVLLAASPLMACECGKGDKTKSASKASKPKAGVVEKRVVTGSHIPQEIRRSGQITDGASPVSVIDQESIRKSGASDVRELLVRKGGYR
jgi:outer membrane cobalamin receptor